jgi:hypothetical protein
VTIPIWATISSGTLESDVNEFLGVSLSRDPKIDYVFDELSKLLASRSPYREDDNPFETAVGVLFP